jgi:hypothetical protein
LVYEAGSLVPVEPVMVGFLARSAALLTFPVILWIGGFFTPQERNALGKYWQGLWFRFQDPVGTP